MRLQDQQKPSVGPVCSFFYKLFSVDLFYIIKFLAYIVIILLLVCLSNGLHARLVGIFTLFSGLVFDVFLCIKSNIGNSKAEKKAKVAGCFFFIYLSGTILFIVFSFICYPQGVSFIVTLRCWEGIDFCVNAIALSGLVSPLIECIYEFIKYDDNGDS